MRSDNLKRHLCRPTTAITTDVGSSSVHVNKKQQRKDSPSADTIVRAITSNVGSSSVHVNKKQRKDPPLIVRPLHLLGRKYDDDDDDVDSSDNEEHEISRAVNKISDACTAIKEIKDLLESLQRSSVPRYRLFHVRTMLNDIIDRQKRVKQYIYELGQDKVKK